MPYHAHSGPLHPTMAAENRAFDTSKLGVGYGFESHPTSRVEMPPTWALLVALGFMMMALGFWVGRNYHVLCASNVGTIPI